MHPLVSVIIPCYKQGHFLGECVASLQAQTYAHWEAIIVDDGSPDCTREVATALAAADKRVSMVHKPNGGLSSARNFGLKYAKGDYFQFLDADDLLLPRKFEAHLEVANVSAPEAVTYTDYLHGEYEHPTVRVDGFRLSCRFIMSRPMLDFAARWEHQFSIPIHAALFPRIFFKQINPPFDETLPNHEDWDLWMRAARAGGKFIFIPQELAIYRCGIQSMSRDPIRMRIGFNLAIQKHLQILRADKESVQCLRYLSQVNDHVYGKGLTKWLHRAIAVGSFYLLPLELRRPMSVKRRCFGLFSRTTDNRKYD